MTNKEIIDNIKSKLSGDKEIDVAYLQTEMNIYRNMKNDEVIYAIANMLFQYLDPKIKEQLDLKTHAILDERREKYERVLDLIESKKYQEAKSILIELSDTFKKASYAKEQNYYDFDQMIEYFIFCETVSNAKKLKIRRYPEPVTYYMYQLSTIYQKENDLDSAIIALEEALNYNPRCQYVMQSLALLYKENGKYDMGFELIKDSLKYAYTKEQLAFNYKYIAEYFRTLDKYDIAIVSYITSDCYKQNDSNMQSVSDLTTKYGKLDLNKTDDIVNIFKKYNLQYGVSSLVINAISEFINYSKTRKDFDTLLYLLDIAYELTDDDYYKEELIKAKKNI